MAVIRSVIRGVGAHLPKRVLTNADLEKMVDTTDEWIVERTGIRARHIAADNELTSDLGIAAAHQALVRAGIDPVDIDLVICATATPDRTFPATAVKIQHGLGVTKDPSLAYTWFAIAARSGDKDAGRRRDEARARLDPAEVAIADEAVRLFVPQPADPLANEPIRASEAWKLRQGTNVGG